MQSLLLSPHRVYFDEYEEIGETCPPKHAAKCERYIAPTDTTYAIEVTLKKGFNYGDNIGIRVKLVNATTNIRIGEKLFEKDPHTTTLDSDKVYVVDNLDQAVVNGVRRNGVSLSFYELVDGQYSPTIMLQCYISNMLKSTDDALKNETDIPGVRPTDLGGVCVSVYKCGRSFQMDLNETKFKDSMIQFEGRMKSMPSNVDGKSYNIHGITHAVG